jgi:cobalt/nickel transport system permease protein
MEGFLPWQWCLFWYIIVLPAVAYCIIQIKKVKEEHPESKPLLAIT